MECNKKAKHKKIEQKRRDGIKQKFIRLRSIVPNCTNETQAVVLEKAVEYIETLSGHYNDLLERSKQLQADYHNLGGKYDYIGYHLHQPVTNKVTHLKMSSMPMNDDVSQLTDDPNVDNSLPLPSRLQEMKSDQ